MQHNSDSGSSEENDNLPQILSNYELFEFEMDHCIRLNALFKKRNINYEIVNWDDLTLEAFKLKDKKNKEEEEDMPFLFVDKETLNPKIITTGGKLKNEYLTNKRPANDHNFSKNTEKSFREDDNENENENSNQSNQSNHNNIIRTTKSKKKKIRSNNSNNFQNFNNSNNAKYRDSQFRKYQQFYENNRNCNHGNNKNNRNNKNKNNNKKKEESLIKKYNYLLTNGNNPDKDPSNSNPTNFIETEIESMWDNINYNCENEKHKNMNEYDYNKLKCLNKEMFNPFLIKMFTTILSLVRIKQTRSNKPKKISKRNLKNFTESDKIKLRNKIMNLSKEQLQLLKNFLPSHLCQNQNFEFTLDQIPKSNLPNLINYTNECAEKNMNNPNHLNWEAQNKNEQELKIFENTNINSNDLIYADSIDDAYKGNFSLTINNNTKRIPFGDDSISESVDSEDSESISSLSDYGKSDNYFNSDANAQMIVQNTVTQNGNANGKDRMIYSSEDEKMDLDDN